MTVDIEVSLKTINHARKFLKERVFNQEHRYEPGKDENVSRVSSIIRRALHFGQCDSVIVVGPRGCGKTTMVNACLNQLEKELSGNGVVVRLNGLVHLNDNLALKDIIYQLHAEELDTDRVTGSFADNLLFLLQSLKGSDKESSKFIVFVLDEFHLFCDHRNQTLLYNLFDAALQAQVPICVVGMTSRVDFSEKLEKRVKSRFSHCQCFIYPDTSLDSRLKLIEDMLTLPKGFQDDKKKKSLDSYRCQWNEVVSRLKSDKIFVDVLKRQLDLDPSYKKLQNWLFSVICQLSVEKPFLESKDFVEGFKSFSVDSKLYSLKDLSVLELCLVIAIHHHVEIYDGEPFNFEMVFKQYMSFAKQNATLNSMHRPILFKVFERLKELELILPLGGLTKTVKKEHQLYSFQVFPDQVKEAVDSYHGLPTDVAQWASSIVI